MNNIEIQDAPQIEMAVDLAIKGVSPKVSFERGEGCTLLNIQDIDGVHTAEIPDGAQGEMGADYNLTEEDKSDIARLVIELLSVAEEASF